MGLQSEWCELFKLARRRGCESFQRQHRFQDLVLILFALLNSIHQEREFSIVGSLDLHIILASIL